MKKLLTFTATLAAASLMAACTSTLQPFATSSAQSVATKAKEAIFKDHSEKDVRKYLAENYIQHNPNLATGVESIVNILPNLEESGIDFTTHRIFQDGNFVVMHNSFTNADALGAKEVISFDIWRIEDGKAAEHWDAITPKVHKTASGRSQIDGPTEVTDKHMTAENKRLVSELVNRVFIQGKSSEIANYISTEQYDQHNPFVKDGLNGLVEAITYLTSQNNMFKYYKVHKLLGEGNFVLAQVEGEWNGKPHVFYDLFRVQNGKVVEHWDIVNEIPEKMAYTNGIF